MPRYCKSFCAIALLSFAGFAQAAASVPAPRTSPAPDMAPILAPALDCVRGFSKDYCGQFYPGHQSFTACPSPFPTDSCRTLRIFGATFVARMSRNNQPCGPTADALCNEVQDGTLKVVSDFTIRLQDSCPYRGCWMSESAVFTAADGSRYSGSLMGTIGVGTHRPMTTPIFCTADTTNPRNCERCYDVSFDAHANTWRIGYEAAFHGVNEDSGEELCFSLSGDFFIAGDATGGPGWSTIWRIVGTADGIDLTFCQ